MRLSTPEPRPRWRLALAVVAALAVLGGGASVALGLASAGQGPQGEPLPTEITGTFTAPTTSGPEVSEAAALSMAANEAHADSLAVSGAAARGELAEDAAPQAIARTTRKTATETIGQGEEPPNADAEVAAWYGGSVYLVSFVGHYEARDAPVPPQAKTPTGLYLTLIVDAYSGKITGFELSNTENLSSKIAAIGDRS
jgi:hypothetical protein